MSCAILPLADGRAVLANAMAEWAFGPVFASTADAQAFIRWLGKDPQDLVLECLLSGRQPDIAIESIYPTWRVEAHTADATA